MHDADMIAGWVTPAGEVVADDYYSVQEEKPKTDVSLGGTKDIKVISGSRTANGYTTLTVSRKLVTGDTQFDKDISVTQYNDMIYAWGTSDTNGLAYHGDNHNHVFIDFSRPDGYPLNTFGEEERGYVARKMVRDFYYGMLCSFQTQAAGSPGLANYPFGAISDFADDGTGRPIILMTDNERSVTNSKDYAPMSFFLHQPPNATHDIYFPKTFEPIVLPRVTLLGKLSLVPADEVEHAQEIYLEKHPVAKAWIGFSDFRLYYFNVEDIYYVGGFGTTHYLGWISAEQYFSIKF